MIVSFAALLAIHVGILHLAMGAHWLINKLLLFDLFAAVLIDLLIVVI